MEQDDNSNHVKQELEHQHYKQEDNNDDIKKEPKLQRQQSDNSIISKSYQSPFLSNLDFLKDEDPDFQLIDSVLWGLDTNILTDELVAKPKADRQDDPCGCTEITHHSSMDDSPEKMKNMMQCVDLSCVLFACLEE